MGKIGKIVGKMFPIFRYFKISYNIFINQYIKPYKKSYWGNKDDTAYIRTPISCSNPRKVFFLKGAKLSPQALILNYTGSFILKENAEISYGLTVITGNHTPTVGLPITVSNALHINDKETDIIVEEDAWLGVNVTLIAGAHIGRGAVVGACALVNKPIPPYAVAVGVPAKIVGVKFSLEQIIEHEKKLYPEEKRMKKEELELLFKTEFASKKHIGTDIITIEDAKRAANYKMIRHF